MFNVSLASTLTLTPTWGVRSTCRRRVNEIDLTATHGSLNAACYV